MGFETFLKSSISDDLFKKTRFRSASLEISLDFFIPIFSTVFLCFLIPAVSKNLTGSPRISIYDSIASLVVPGLLETIAISWLETLFIKLDLPVFVFPIIPTIKPSRIFLPLLFFDKILYRFMIKLIV